MVAPRAAGKFLNDIAAPVASAALRILLPIVRFMADCQALGEDVWGEKLGSSDLQLLTDSGRWLVKGEDSSVSYLARAKKKIDVYDFLKQLGKPRSDVLRIDTKALDVAEDVLSNTTLSRLDSATMLVHICHRLRNWDILFWQRRLSLSKEPLKHSADDFSTYFTLSRVLSGAFGLLNRLWGMHVVENVHDKPPVWHPDVRHFQLFNGTELLGSFFFDPFARPGKLSVPFTQPLMKRSEGYVLGKDRTPVVVMSTSIHAPEPGDPTVLQLHDVLAIFHELGHVVQNLANQNNEVLVAGTTTLPLDFSQQSFCLQAAIDDT
ncbi:M3 peptidase [Helicosporidium sp. ATCC 50920]|nr:M3 peptidase [Helicosporidium sp. ATCC 50920]|eukprot:KDD73212.1 M3 peptidase [Helicosporidium sp. ATCC 50920]